MRDVQVGDIWMWKPIRNAIGKKNKSEHWLISNRADNGEWLAIAMNEECAGEEIEITINDMGCDWTKVA